MDVTGWVSAATCGSLLGLSLEEVESIAVEDRDGRFMYRTFSADISGTEYEDHVPHIRACDRQSILGLQPWQEPGGYGAGPGRTRARLPATKRKHPRFGPAPGGDGGCGHDPALVGASPADPPPSPSPAADAAGVRRSLAPGPPPAAATTRSAGTSEPS